MASVKELPSKPSYTTCFVYCILPHFDPHRNILHHFVITFSPQTATKAGGTEDAEAQAAIGAMNAAGKTDSPPKIWGVNSKH